MSSIFDMHMYLGKSLFHKDFFLENLQKLQKEYSLTKAGIIPTKPFAYDYEGPNKDLRQIAQQHQELQHILRVDPWRNEQSINMVKNTTSSVLFLHFFEEQIYPTNPLVMQVVEEAQSKNLAVMLASGYLPFSHSAQVQPLVNSFPDVRFILTHGGQINISGMHMAEAFEIFRENDNTFFETSGIYREDYIEDAIDKLGSERVLFGSGSPYYYFPFEVRRIEHLKTSSSIKEKIFYKNAHAFFSSQEPRMCRIVGVVNTQKKMESFVPLVEKMRDSLTHGGPDDRGIYVGEHVVLGHRRLSIIDLSSNAQQPFIVDDVVIVYNGEIYNFRELKLSLERAGHHFTSSSDTEVIVKAYLQWGEDSFAKLHGMFAFALLDNRKNSLYLVRDHSGIKPLYFYYDNKQVIFASEIRAFYHYESKWKKSEHWQELFLAFGHIPEPYTILHDVYMVAKGTYHRFHIGTELKKEEHRYTQFYFTDEIKDERTATTIVRNSLQNAIDKHLICDAPLGVFLSGGIDSSLIALVAKEFKEDLSTLSIVFDESSFSEEKYQKIIVDKICSKHVSYKITASDFIQALPDIFKTMDQPTTDGVNTYFISQCAQKAGFKAVLAGIGGDELFAGYTTFSRGEKLLRLPCSKLLGKLGWLLPNNFKRLVFLQLNSPYKYYLVLRGFFCPNEIALLLGKSQKSIWDFLQQMNLDIAKCTPRDYISLLELDLYMKNQLLRDSDVMGMRHSLEIRVPFLDRGFVHDIFRIEQRLRLSKKFPKQLLVEAFSDLIPDEIVYRKKQGFVFPFANWLQTHCRKSFHDKVIKSPINAEFCAQLWDKFVHGKVHWSKIWAIWVLCEYLDQQLKIKAS